MTGYIAVEVHDHEAHYEARCACGWVGVEETAIEWAETSLLSHFAKAHNEEQAA